MSAVAWQPAGRSLSTVVRTSQSGPQLTPPVAASVAWVASQRAWVDLAVNQPVELSGTDAKGMAWSSRVHVLGVVHSSAANVRSVHEVAAAVTPDAVGLEQDSSNVTYWNLVTQAARSAPMMKLVNRLMDTPLESYAQAHGQLSTVERMEWEGGLRSARLALLGPRLDELEPHHHLLGWPEFSDAISAKPVEPQPTAADRAAADAATARAARAAVHAATDADVAARGPKSAA
ncbi:hypothetical protein FOA52_003172 [Chlamydomonas sp. UWO 241]|nr:hypothetical protein FOA52_003172 [Chlamydomonas sp. UWO 241]